MRNIIRDLHARQDVLRAAADPLCAAGCAAMGDGVARSADGAGDVGGDQALRVSLPWPPSVNRIWRSVKIRGSGRVLLSREGREYRRAVKIALRACTRVLGAYFSRPVSVQIAAHPPDARRRDLDNVLKAVLDAITHAGVWDDDRRVDDLHIWRMPPVAGGRIDVVIASCTRDR